MKKSLRWTTSLLQCLLYFDDHLTYSFFRDEIFLDSLAGLPILADFAIISPCGLTDSKASKNVTHYELASFKRVVKTVRLSKSVIISCLTYSLSDTPMLAASFDTVA